MVNYYGKATPASGSGGGSGDAVWGAITGTLSDQTDLQTALNAKQDTLTAGSGIDITNNVISATISGLQNTATGNGSLTILGTPTSSNNALNIGTQSEAGDYSVAIGCVTGDNDHPSAYKNAVAIGYQAQAYHSSVAIGYDANAGSYSSSENSIVIGSTAWNSNSNSYDSPPRAEKDSIAIGASAQVYANSSIAIGCYGYVDYNYDYSIALGYGATASSDYSFYVGFGFNNGEPLSYKLLDGTTGKIPNDRLNAFTGATSSVAGSVGAVPAPTTSDVGKFLSADGTWATAGGSVDIDESTITENASNKLQAVGVVNQNTAEGATSPLKLWEGTEQEWEQDGGSVDLYYGYSRVKNSNSTLPSSGTWNAITYGNGKFIALIQSSKNAAYSTNGGATWNALELPLSAAWNSATFGDGTFILQGSSTILYSTDNGTSWKKSTLLGTGTWRATAFGNGTFIVIGQSTDKANYSTDGGATWTESTLPASLSWNSIAFGNGAFVVVAQGSDQAAYSTDNGLTWTAVTLPSSATWRATAFGNGTFVTVGYSSDKVAYSTDNGHTWTETQLPSSGSWNGVVFGDGKFVASCQSTNKVAYSYDGITWLEAPLPVSKGWRAIGYGEGKFIVIASSATDAPAVMFETYYTAEAEPTTSSQVYSAPAILSGLTITAVDTGSITLSDTNTYIYNVNNNRYSYKTIGETYPTWLCNIEGVGVKIGNTLIADATGNVLPTQTGNSGKYLTTDGTTASWATVSSGGLQNTATGTDSLTILGTATTAANATNIGVTSDVTGNYSTALGYGAGVTSGATRAIQIGEGTNSVSNTFSVGFGVNNYQILDGTTGKIPNDRINGVSGSFTSQDGKTITVTNGVITSIV